MCTHTRFRAQFRRSYKNIIWLTNCCSQQNKTSLAPCSCPPQRPDSDRLAVCLSFENTEVQTQPLPQSNGGGLCTHKGLCKIPKTNHEYKNTSALLLLMRSSRERAQDSRLIGDRALFLSVLLSSFLFKLFLFFFFFFLKSLSHSRKKNPLFFNVFFVLSFNVKNGLRLYSAFWGVSFSYHKVISYN